jgi:signal transduction histidine kinase
MTARRVAWGIWGITVGLLVVWLFIAAAANTLVDEWIFYVLVPIAVVSYATVGALITSRHPENRIGLILAGVALAFAVAVTAGDYTTLATHRADSLPFARWVTWIGRVTFALWLAPLPLLFLLYPNGRVLSRRWGPVLWVLLAALGVNLTLLALTPGAIETGFTESGGATRNPVGLPLAWKVPVERATELAGLVAFICAALAAVSLVLRYRRAPAEERQQIRWLGYVGAILLAVPALGLAVALIRALLGVHVSEDNDIVGIVGWSAFMIVLLFGVPAACAIAILRYRLYELDVVVKKTVQYGVLLIASLIVIGLLVLVPGILFVGIDAQIVPGIAVGAALAAVLWLLRTPAQRIANRIVYGQRSTPYEVLSEFSERVGGTYSTEDVLPRMAQLLGEATGAREARVWLRVGGHLRPEAAWPADAPTRAEVALVGGSLPDLDGAHAFAITHQGEILGALTVQEAANDPITPSKGKLARDMASQAGLVLRNVRLIEDLRESRRRIVSAQDERAKKLERDIHDGAQQQLVALAVKLRIAEGMVDRAPAKAHELLADLQVQATETLEDLRDLARGIYPPLLADKGLPSALAAQGGRSAIPITISADAVDRYGQDVESAVYFSCLEAMNNAAKYAKASSVHVSLQQEDGVLRFDVTDDGRGFDPSSTTFGTGLQSIADRLEALGGSVTIRSIRGEGTTVSGSVPVGMEARA